MPNGLLMSHAKYNRNWLNNSCVMAKKLSLVLNGHNASMPINRSKFAHMPIIGYYIDRLTLSIDWS